MPSPNFYKIDFEREVVLQGRTTTFVTITRDDTVMAPNEVLYIIGFPQAYTFEQRGEIITGSGAITSAVQTIPFTEISPADPNKPAFNRITQNLVIRNWWDLDPAITVADAPVNVISYTPGLISVESQNSFSWVTPVPANTVLKLGSFAENDGNSFKINAAKAGILADTIYKSTNPGIIYTFETSLENPFDGTLWSGAYGTDSGYITRQNPFWTKVNFQQITSSDGNEETNGVTFRIDYDGKNDAHLKLNFFIFKSNTFPVLNSFPYPITEISTPFGLKSGDGAGNFSSDVDYQEIHFFGYPEDYVRPTRDTANIELPILKPLYDDKTSYGLLKTNPKLSGNVKITVDSKGDIWLNSFNANQELSDASYKKFAISPLSTYQKDLYSFFKNGQTPSNIVFDLYQYDDQYLNTKQSFSLQFDNFYNYGVEQLNSKFYDENFSFLAPIWLRKNLPDFFVILRVDHPVNPDTYNNVSLEDTIKDYMNGARIIKTFDLRQSSKMGTYIRNLVNDPRWDEKPLEFSWDINTPTYWSGAVYTQGTLSSKGELIYDYIKQDRPIKEFEEFITGGFQRNNIISTNLLNLEFLFDDEEAPLYSINRYIGFYVTENQLAEFEIEPSVLGKITGQTPPPKPGVDGQPYSTKAFIQSNPNGIQIPVHYYHDTPFTNNTSIVPTYQGLVLGKFPLPSMVDDPLRLFYVKDRDNVFKKVRKLTEVNYGSPTSPDFIRATQLELFDMKENISQYGGVTDIVSQFPATLLNSGNSQLRLHLLDQYGTGCIANDEELILEVKKYNNPGSIHTYFMQVIGFTPGTSLTLAYFIGQQVVSTTAPFTQPNVGNNVIISVTSSANLTVGQSLYIVGGGYYSVISIPSSSTIEIKNLGNAGNALNPAVIPANKLVGSSLGGIATYNVNPLNTYLSIDNYVKVNLVNFVGGYSVGDAWQVDLIAPSIQKFILNGINNIDAEYTPQYQQFRWRMIANGQGLQPGDAWDYPLLDPNGVDYVSNFSNEGTLAQVAKAIAKCVNSFEGLPVNAWVDDTEIYLKSTLLYEEGNSILFKRMLKGNSYYANIGFYEVGNVNRGTVLDTNILQINPSLTTDSYDISAKVLLQPDQIINQNYLVQVTRSDVTTNIIIRVGINNSSWALATSTGTPYIFNIPTKDETFTDVNIPITFDLTKIPVNTAGNWVFTQSSSVEVEQYFVGGEKRLRNRAKIDFSNGTNYYQNRKVTRTGNVTISSPVVYVDTTDLYVGAPISGEGIPIGAKVIDVNIGFLVMDVNATATSTNLNISIGEITILNDNKITQQWYQSLKGVYSRMKGWDVQGKYIYSLPYLDQPVYNVENYLDGFTDYKNYSIIQLDKKDQEFYYSNDSRIVAYKVYRPTFGIFSIYPIKEFDFDFIFSEYSYTPTLELFKYFFKEEATSGEYIELELFENFKIQHLDSANNPTSGSYELTVEAFDVNANAWTEIDKIRVPVNSLSSGSLLFNTFYPLYDYDMNSITLLPDGYPYLAPSPGQSSLVTPTQSRAVGNRNYDRRYLVKKNTDTNESIIFKPSKLRVLYTGISSTANKILVTNYNYEDDKDLKLFNGFAGIQDVTGIQDAQIIENLKQQGEYIQALTYQLLLSEYDRLRENFNKDWAVKSKTVPYVNKWVQEGTDARDNYYRLNSSLAFGLNNLSPSSQVDFAEPSVLTHEFPYLDTIPQDYPIESLETSRSYFFGRLNDVIYRGKTWYELIINDNTNDWFTKYFTLGYPTEIFFGGKKIPKSRDERFTFFKYIEGVGKSQTLFRGAKIQITQYEAGPNITTPLSTPIQNSTAFQDYKFSAIARFLPYEEFTPEKPADIEIIKNDKYKTITMIITVRVKDYRTQSGHIDYALQYFSNDILKNTNQNQFPLNYSLPIAPSTISAPTSTTLRNFLPYDSQYVTYTYSYVPESVLRPRQGFLGGGYLQLGDKKPGGILDYSLGASPNWQIPLTATQSQLFMAFISVDPATYSFNLLNEITTISNSYRIPSTYPFIYDSTSLPITAKEFGNDGYEFNIHNLIKKNNQYGGEFVLWNFFDSQNKVDILTLDTLKIGSASKYNRFRTQYSTFGLTTLSALSSSTTIVPGALPTNSQIKETYFVNGGSGGFSSIKNYLTFGNIQNEINSNNALIEYYNVTDAGKVLAYDYRINIINPDSLVKENVLGAIIDEDKPVEYQPVSVIGYDIVGTNGQEYITRHRGYYEPKSRDILTFWLREDESFSKHFQLDFLLSNTHINAKSNLSGLVRNYGINKIATGGDIMAISVGSSYKSLYPLVGEVSVTNKDYNAFSSSWDNNFYRNYTTTTNYVDLYGISEMKETKAFLASKAMNVPKSFDLHNYITDIEYTYVLEQPAAVIGIDALAANNAAVQQGLQYSNKPKVIITIDLEERLRRELLAGISNINNVDEFSRLLTIGVAEFNSLSSVEIENLKTQYINKNIINIYQVSDIIFYALPQQGIELVDGGLTEIEKVRAGYKVDKDCVVTQLSAYKFQITKILNPATPVGFSFSATIKRI